MHLGVVDCIDGPIHILFPHDIFNVSKDLITAVMNCMGNDVLLPSWQNWCNIYIESDQTCMNCSIYLFSVTLVTIFNSIPTHRQASGSRSISHHHDLNNLPLTYLKPTKLPETASLKTSKILLIAFRRRQLGFARSTRHCFDSRYAQGVCAS